MKRIFSYLGKGFALTVFGFSLSGCTSLTGLIDAADEFGCPLGKGTNCTTLTATHKRVTQELDDKKDENTLKVARPKKEPQLKSNANEVNAPYPNLEEKETLKQAQTEALYQSRINEPLASNVIATKRKANLSTHTGNTRGVKARMPERVMFLWVLPWVDTDGDLHGESRIWVKVKDARWGVEKLRLEAMSRGAPEMTP